MLKAPVRTILMHEATSCAKIKPEKSLEGEKSLQKQHVISLQSGPRLATTSRNVTFFLLQLQKGQRSLREVFNVKFVGREMDSVLPTYTKMNSCISD